MDFCHKRKIVLYKEEFIMHRESFVDVIFWVLLNRAHTSTQLYPPQSTSTQLISASTQLSTTPSTMGVTKPCTQLHPAQSTSTQLISNSTQLHLHPPSSFQSPSSSLQHPQQYSNQNIARNWAISLNLGWKI